MERLHLIGSEHVRAQLANQSNYRLPSFWRTCISLKILQPTASGKDDRQVSEHDTHLVLGLHVPKRYLIIAQKVEADNTEVYLRFPISLNDFSHTFTSEEGTSKLCIFAHSMVRHEIIHSDQVHTPIEHDIERGLVQLSCTLPARAFETETTFVIQPKDASHEYDLQRLVYAMEKMLEGDSNIPINNRQGEETGNWYTPKDHPARNGPWSGKSRTETRQTPYTSSAAVGNLAGDEFNDMWQGLEQLDVRGTVNPPAINNVAEKLSSARSNSFMDFENLIPELTPSANAVASYSTSGESSRPFTPADDLLEANTISPWTGYLAPTGDISTIQSLPSAVFSPLNLATISPSPPTRSYTHTTLPPRNMIATFPVLPIGEYTPSGSLRGHLAEQERQMEWESRSAQWGLLHSRRKYTDAKFNSVSGTRPPNDIRVPYLSLDRAAELRGVTLRNASERGGNGRTQVQTTVRSATVGSGRGVFGLASGKLIPRAMTSDHNARYPAARGEQYQRGTRGRGQPRGRRGDIRGRGRRGAWSNNAAGDGW